MARKISRNEADSSVIDLTSKSNSDKHHSSNTSRWVQFGDTSLSLADRHIILYPTAWMNDLIISAGQNLLKKETQIKGFQHSILGEVCAFKVQKGEFIQVLNASNHWLTISTIGVNCGEVILYDSLYSGAGLLLKKQICSIIHTNEKEVTLIYPHVQQQSGTCDCGLFALAFATCLVNGIKPETQMFKQDLMRQHLYKCFQEGKMSMFPSTARKNTLKRQYRAVDTFSINCNCRNPEYGDMVQCSKCNEWYHISCVNVPQTALNSSEIWLCECCCS